MCMSGLFYNASPFYVS